MTTPRTDTTDFLKRTNEDYAAWCKAFYQPDALDHRGFADLHGLWAWQEQERRAAAIKADLAAARSELAQAQEALVLERENKAILEEVHAKLITLAHQDSEARRVAEERVEELEKRAAIRAGNCILSQGRGGNSPCDGLKEAEQRAQRAEALAESIKTAAQAVIDRWDTPLWKDAEHTGEVINRLRSAIDAAIAGEKK